MAGTVMLIGSALGALGALQESEFLVRVFLSTTYWTMAVLTSLIYIQYDYMDAVEKQCKPSQADLSGGNAAGSCSKQRTEVGVAVVFCLVGLLITFVCNYLCSGLLDNMNDLTKLNDMALFVRYFTY
eukprot:gene14534-29116_t